MRNKEIQNRTVAELRQAVRINPRDGEAWLALAKSLAQIQTGGELHQAITKSIELLPDDYQAWVLAGLDMQKSRGTTAALQWLHRIAQQRPKLAAPRLARAQLQTAEPGDSAAQDFQSIIQDFPNDARAHLLYAEHLQNLGHVNAAGDQLEMALNIKPEIVQNWEALAMLRLAEGRFDAVAVAASRALDIDSQARSARMSRAEACRQAGQWQRAMEDYLVLLKVMPDNPYLMLGLGACLAGSGDFEAALEPLNGALHLRPEFPEASLNIAMVLASLGKSFEALNQLTLLLEQNRLPEMLRTQALITQAALQEQQRLPTLLNIAAETHNLQELQDALQSAPAILLQTDQRTEASLRDMALASQQFSMQLPVMEHGLDAHQVAFVEACFLSRKAENADELVELWQAQKQHETEGKSLDAVGRNLRNTWNIVLERQHLCVLQDNPGNGEALLRYWHFRMFEETAGYLPGLFKFAPNKIGLHHTTAPQQVIKCVRVLMDEIYPSLPAGLGRALYLLASVNRVHAFTDGNGRMARFLFSSELEYAHLPPIQWAQSLRKLLVHCLDGAQYQHDFEAFRQGLQQAQSSTETLFKEFSERLTRN